MRKIKVASLLFAALVFGPWRPAAADPILDQLYGGFVGRAKLSLESTTKGTVQPEFLVNYIEIGQLNGSHIAAIDAGALGTVLPSGGFKSVDWTTGGKIHLSPIIKQYVPLPAEWQFLAELELDARGSYNWTAHQPSYGLVASVPFK